MNAPTLTADLRRQLAATEHALTLARLELLGARQVIAATRGRHQTIVHANTQQETR